jgi:hypothetical protein
LILIDVCWEVSERPSFTNKSNTTLIPRFIKSPLLKSTNYHFWQLSCEICKWQKKSLYGILLSRVYQIDDDIDWLYLLWLCYLYFLMLHNVKNRFWFLNNIFHTNMASILPNALAKSHEQLKHLFPIHFVNRPISRPFCLKDSVLSYIKLTQPSWVSFNHGFNIHLIGTFALIWIFNVICIFE